MNHLTLLILPASLALGAAFTACMADGGDTSASNRGALSAASHGSPSSTASSGEWHPGPAASGSTPNAPTALPPFEWAASCPSAPGPFVARPLPRGSIEELRAYLDAVRADLIGHWVGVATTPWVPAYTVHIAFDADGQYRTRSSAADTPALYWGTDHDTPLKQWVLDDLSIVGEASGSLDVAFEYDPGQFGLAAWAGELEDVTVDASGSRARLSLSTSSGYGPVQLDLWRCP